MAEVQARGVGTRGRGGFRGGRGGFRGGRHSGRTHQRADNEQENIPPTSLEDQGEIGELKRKFGDKLPLLTEICPGWSDEDLVYALNETDGDVNEAIDRISSGTISQWGEVKKKHPKPKEVPTATAETGTRGRGRGGFEGRGRGRGAERGARGGRGAKSVAQTNGTKDTKAADGWDTVASTQGADTGAGWDTVPTNGDNTGSNDDWANEPGKDSLNSLQTEEPKPASGAAPATAKPGGWAGLFAKPPPAPKQAPAPPPPAAKPEEPAAELEPALVSEMAQTEPALPPPIESASSEIGPSELPSAPHSDTGKELTPAKDELTEKNLEKLPDTSHPVASGTAASTVASTVDPLAAHDNARPAIRPGMSGFAATALKATAGGSRTTSYARKVMDQQEAVVMPGHQAIEKAAVQFGKLGMNAPDDVDVDEDREEPETRTQLPDDSPVAPRASLPPSLSEAQQIAPSVQAQAPADSQPMMQRQAPGLPPAPQQAQQPSPQSSSAYADQYRYGQSQKYDPFGQQTQTAQVQAQNQEPFSNQVPGQPGATASQNDYASYYGRDAYNYYGGYGQGQDAHRTANSFGTSAPDTQAQYATSRPQQGMAQDTQGSGQNTPAPGMPSHPSQQHSGHMQSQGHGYPGYGYPNAYNQQYPQYSANYMNQMTHRYGANRPMFDDARRQAQQAQQAQGQQQQDSDYYGGQYNYGQNHYGGAYNSKMYGQPQQGYSYEHSSSPANTTGYGREAGYGRTGSAQPADAPPSASGSAAFGSVPDPFGRTSSGFGQTQQHGAHSGSDDPTKASGPSPSMQGGRPTSAVNSLPGQQGGLPPPSQPSGQQAFGGYPQYGGGFGSHQSAHQNTGYGGYGSNTGFGTYGGYGGGRGWNGSYGSGH
ncbi:RNAPII degradation factor [Exophiala xenobiotica]|nr:RNAPII degradation factor [Exophiala xenobiotica]KAK5223284.1 RNAPII degradation factor [Exophiala xenobiotica]KAK5248579.1 RNAPII degradation factor [Exophiala xenobiotica]KAK5283302.1 RNAPII degradation factor [Exophiala xenobiotica]KAK5345482.1 RNAPII degradation factor [Exophiala xenobiotica]